jgi:NAD(P)-dependent dehydrogenase (short-subunit alcohol dehydrogenase family)
VVGKKKIEKMMRKVLLTGASGGLGRAIAHELLRRGNFVYLVCNRNADKLAGIQKDFPGKTLILTHDFESEQPFDQLFEHVEDVDTVIHALGVSSAGMCWKITEKEWDRAFRLNVTVPFQITQKVIPAMRSEQFGRIIFFSSVVAQKGFIGTSAYAASKSAIFGLVRSMAADLATSGITVNCVAPGYINSGMIKEVKPEYLEKVVSSIPMQELGEEKHILHAINYLMDEKSTYVTGQVLNVNGGLV